QAASRTTCLPRANGTGTSWARMPTDPRKVKCLRDSARFLFSLRTLYYKFMRSCFKRTLRSARFSPMRRETKLGHEMLCGVRELILFRRAILASRGHAFSSSDSVARFNGLQCLLGGGADVGARVAEHFLERRHCGDGLGALEAQGARGSN